MNEKYIVEGPALAKLLRENRIRIARGELTFTPLVGGDEKKTEPVVVDDKDNKDIPPVETKVPAEEKDGETPSEESNEKEIEDSKDVVADDSKDVAPVKDNKDIPEEDTKEVTPEEDTKEVAPEEEKKTAPKKSKK